MDHLYGTTRWNWPVVNLKYGDWQRDSFGVGLHRGVLFNALWRKAHEAGVQSETGRDVIQTLLSDPGWTVRTAREGLGPMVRYYDLFMRFLVIVGLSSLMIGGVSVCLVLEALDQATTKISLRVPNELLGRTKHVAENRGVPYQSLMKALIDQGVRRLERVPPRSKRVQPNSLRK